MEDVPSCYLDVNADGFVSPMDALVVVNYLNRFAQKQAAPEASDKPFTNPADPLDVDGSGLVTISDVDLVMQELNRGGSRKLDPTTDRALFPPFFDVNGDGFVSAHDALPMVNRLNAVEADCPIRWSSTPHSTMLWIRVWIPCLRTWHGTCTKLER